MPFERFVFVFVGVQVLALAMVLVLAGRRRITVDWLPTKTHVIRLVRTGVPIVVAGFLYQLLVTVDRVILEAVGTPYQLGLYSFATIAVQIVSMAALPVSELFVVRLAGMNRANALAMQAIRRATLVVSVSAAAGVCVVFLLATWLVLPQYRPALPVVLLSIVTGLVADQLVASGTVFIARGHRWAYSFVLGAGVVLLSSLLRFGRPDRWGLWAVQAVVLGVVVAVYFVVRRLTFQRFGLM